MADLYIFDFPKGLTEEFLWQLLSEAAPVEMVQIFHESATAWAVARFVDYMGARRALDVLNYVKLDGQPIRIEWGDEETRRIRNSGRGVIVLKNLDPSLEPSQLHEALGKWGEVIYCKMAADTDRSAVCYAQFRNPKDAGKCVKDLQECEINGRPACAEKVGLTVCISGLPECVVDWDSFLDFLMSDFPEVHQLVHDISRDRRFVSERKRGLRIEITGALPPDFFAHLEAPDGFGRKKLCVTDASAIVDALDGARIDGAVIKACLYGPKQNKVRDDIGVDVETGPTLYVRGFDKDIHEAELMKQFEMFGNVKSVKIARSRRYALVCFYTYESAEKARQWSYLIGSGQLHCEFAYRGGKAIKECPFQPVPFDDL